MCYIAFLQNKKRSTTTNEYERCANFAIKESKEAYIKSIVILYF